MSNPATGRDNSKDHLLNYLSEIRARPFDITDRERIRAQQEIMAEEDPDILPRLKTLAVARSVGFLAPNDRNIFAAMNSVITSDQREQMKIEELRKSRKVVSSIFELEIE